MSKDPVLDSTIQHALIELKAEQPTSAEYATILGHVKELYKLQADKPKPVDPNTMLTVAANLTGILLILQHERMHVVASKALTFVMKLR